MLFSGFSFPLMSGRVVDNKAKAAADSVSCHRSVHHSLHHSCSGWQWWQTLMILSVMTRSHFSNNNSRSSNDNDDNDDDYKQLYKY